jgi:hypothetical protein
MRICALKVPYILAVPHFMPNQSLRLFPIFAVLLAVVLSSPVVTRADGAAQAPVLLAQRWQAGQQWPYDVEITGKLDMRFPPDTPMLARMTFKGLDFSLKNLMTLDVLKSDDKGTGTVALRTEDVALDIGSTAGRMEVRDGVMRVFVNNRPLGQPSPMPLDALKNPDHAARLDARGHYLGSEPIPGGQPANVKLPPYLENLLHALDPSLLPALWPEKPVAPGDTWTNPLSLPLENQTPEARHIGDFQWTYVGEEADAANAARKLQHLQLDGTVKISPEQAALLAAQIGDTRPGTPQETVQKLKGDVWFDTQIGQVRRADLKLQFYSARQAQSKIRDRVIDDSSWTIFDGKVQMNLREPVEN